MCVPTLHSTRQNSVLKLMLGYDDTTDIQQQQRNNNISNILNMHHVKTSASFIGGIY